MDSSGISEFLKTRVLPLWEEAVLLETLKKCFIFFFILLVYRKNA